MSDASTDPIPEDTDNSPRPEDGEQPAHVPAPGVVDGVQTDDEEFVDVTDYEAGDL